METHYKSSKGAMLIADMPLRYASNALAKLRRDEPERVAEIEALAAHVVTAEQSPPGAKSADIGDNGGPPLETAAKLNAWGAIQAYLDDLLTEAANWADGAAIASREQADAVARIKQDLQQSINDADAARMEEKRPLDEQIAEIQDRYNAYIAPLKNKAPGKASKAIAALNNALSAWLRKLDDEKRTREREAASIAAAAAAEALAARAEAKVSTDLAAMDEADDKLAHAEALIKQAKGVGAEKVQAIGSTRAVGLRSFWAAQMIEGKGGDALRHYLATKPDRVRLFLQSLADEDVRNGARAIPGFHITEDRRVA
jgi:NADH dehydrogenase/NADH:ubiquinone oxidoreductase subunit G